HLALGLADDVNPAPRNRAHETFALELGHGFAHGRAADAEIRSEPPLVEPDVGAAAVDVHGHDRVFERGVGAGLEAVRAGDRLDAGRYRGRGVGRRWARDADGTGATSTLTHGWYTIFHGLDRCNRPPPSAPLTSRSGRQPAINGRVAAAKKAAGGEPVHTAQARAALRDRCDAEEEPLSDLAARFVYSPLLSTPFKVVCLFCLFGLLLSAAIVPMIAPEYMAWVLSHIE